MALVNKTYTFSPGAVMYSSHFNTNFDDLYNDYNGNITNANISGSANISDTKLAQISTAGKVSGAALTSLASVPSGAGALPAVNGGCPAGSMVMWSTNTAPTGWLLCYGQAVSRTTYADLFAVVSTTFGTGDGSTTFNVPDFRGRFPLGQDDMGGSSANRVTATEADTIGSSGGSETISTSNLPAHTHSLVYDNAAGGGGTSDVCAGTSTNNGTGATGSAGSGTAYTQPFLTINYIIKY